MGKISIIVTGYNEETRADKLFQSVKMFDEIICVDYNSTDNTRDIAKKKWCKSIKCEEYWF